VANGAPRLQAEPQPSRPVLASFRDVAALVEHARQATLHAHLVHSVHVVRFAPPVIELRPQPEAPRDLAARLSAVLTEATGTRWTIALSSEAGAPTLAEQGDAADHARRSNAATHPLVQAILVAFPGARIDAVLDSATDRYGLTAAPAEVSLGGEGEPAGFELPPPGSDDFDEPSDFWENAP
jgi:DNA polymerase-3 subunit gamma/tau